MKKIFVLVLSLVLAFTTSNCGGSKSSVKKYRIAVIPKGSTHEYWKLVHAGAEKAARELSTRDTKVEIIWKGPLREDNREEQIQVVEGFISQNVNGIVLAPLDNNALVRPIEEAARANIPTVIFDSRLESNNIVSYVATDNAKGGRLAADRLGQLLGGKGNVLMLRCQEGSASTDEREAGFLDQMKANYPEIKMVSTNQYGGSTRETAKAASESLLNQYGDQLQGVFTSAEPITAGMLLSLQDMGQAGKIIFVGFDTNQTFFQAMRNKQLHGIVAQHPFEMGYISVRNMVAHLNGETVEKIVDTGVTMLTPDDVDDPQIQGLLKPPMEQQSQQTP